MHTLFDDFIDLLNGGNAIDKLLFVCNIGIAVSEIQTYRIRIT